MDLGEGDLEKEKGGSMEGKKQDTSMLCTAALHTSDFVTGSGRVKAAASAAKVWRMHVSLLPSHPLGAESEAVWPTDSKRCLNLPNTY